MKCSICSSDFYEDEGNFRKGERILHIELPDYDRPYFSFLLLLLELTCFLNAYYEWIAGSRLISIPIGAGLLFLSVMVLFSGEQPDIKHFHNIDEVEEIYLQKPVEMKIINAKVVGNWEVKPWKKNKK